MSGDAVRGAVEDGGVARVIEKSPTAIQFSFYRGDAFYTEEPFAGRQLCFKDLGASRVFFGVISITAECECAFFQVQA